MTFLDILKSPPADIEKLQKGGNVPALIRLMGHTDPNVRWQAARALGTFGAPAVIPLIGALCSPDTRTLLGAVEALGAIRDARSVQPLTGLLHRKRSIEVRMAVVFALGEIGSPEAVPELILLLRDPDKYIRYGAALALDQLGWHAPDETDLIYSSIARQDWEAVKKYGHAAIPPLSWIFRDSDPSTRSGILMLMRELGEPDPHPTCRAGLGDRDPGVRWTAVLCAMNCGIRSINLPPLVAGRERTGPDPAAAALLNFLFLGIGYNYIGKWWGFPVFMTYMSILVLAQLYAGPFLPYLVAYPITALLGVHTYYMAERMSDL
jgi:HEAT repeats